MKAPVNAPSEKEFQLPEQGTQIAICVAMYHMGNIDGYNNGQPAKKDSIMLRWELPNDTIEIDGKQIPLIVQEEYRFSMSEKANLRKLLESWRGAKFTDEQAADFDIEKVLGAPCFLNIIHTVSKSGKTYAKVAAAVPMPKGTTVPKPYNEPIAFDVNEFNLENFNKLPEFIQKKIKTSTEYQKLVETGAILSQGQVDMSGVDDISTSQHPNNPVGTVVVNTSEETDELPF